MYVTRYVVFVATISLAPLYGVLKADAVPLASHRAVYELSASAVSDTSEIESLSGRWVFEFKAPACEAYTAESRLVMRFETTQGPRLIDRRTTSLESADGSSLTFKSQSFTDEELSEDVEGSAQRNESGVTVKYSKPEPSEATFGLALFPTMQIVQLLEKARAGIHFYETAIFDGTELIDDITNVSVVVGKAKPLKNAEKSVLGKLSDDAFLPVTMAYFEPVTDQTGEHVSDYDVSFKMHENGVQSDVVIRYEDYTMSAKLVELTLNNAGGDLPVDCAKGG